MMQPHIVVTITSPSGVVVDVSNRIDSGGVNAISEQTGEDLLEIVHSDMDLTLHDADGAIEAFFANAAPDDVYELCVDRETQRRRPKYERVFWGMLDLPWSLRFNRKAKTAHLQVFSFSKLLERFGADGLKRDASGYTATVIASTKSITVTPGNSDAFRIGDTVTLIDGSIEEEHVLASLTEIGVLTTVDTITNAFTDSPIVIETPWPRHQTVKGLAELLFAEAGIDHTEITLNDLAALNDVPFLQGWTNLGLTDQERRHLIWMPAADSESGDDVIQMQSGPTDTYAEGETPDGEWDTYGTSQVVNGDWTPYKSTKPSTLVGVDSGAVNKDIQRYGIVTVDGSADWNQAFDHDGGERWGVRRSTSSSLGIYKDGSLEEAIVVSSGSMYGMFIEFFPSADYGLSQDLAVISYVDTDDNDFIQTWDGVTLRTMSTTAGGGGCRTIHDRQVVAIQRFGDDLSATAQQAGTIDFFDGSDSGALLSLNKSTPLKEPPMNMWTMRSIGDYMACLYQKDSTTRCRVWLWSDLSRVDDFQVSDTTNESTFMTKFQVPDTDGTLRDVLVGIVGNTGLFMLCHALIGTIPYADFGDDSVGAALGNLALFGMSIVEVDRYKVGRLRARNISAGATMDIDAPMEQEHVPVFEFYKASVEVSGTADDGSEVSAIVGGSDSARRLELESDLVTTTSLATAIANLYWSFYSVQRVQESVVLREAGTILRTLDRVRLTGREYMVIEPDLDLLNREQRAELVSV